SGSNPMAQTVNISNDGAGILEWSVSTTAAWLSLSPVSGTAPSSFTATVNITSLAAGTYSATITVTGTGATNTPQSIPVALTVSAPTLSSSTPSTSPSTVSLTWNPNTDPGVTGYFVHYGTQSPNLTGSCSYEQSTFYPVTSLTSPSSPSVTINNLVEGTIYYFAVSAYNGFESACSNEVSKAT
ncbi:fibronectin type III domain-containing protein, partial [Petrachloros mirabilis]